MKERLKEELIEIIGDYEQIEEYVTEFNNKTFIEFDYYTVNSISLFVIPDEYDFGVAKTHLQKINDTLPSIKRIFQKPIIHLTEDNEVLPSEAVRLINNETLNHIAIHSELWSDITPKGIKPNKLLTRTYRDNYSIYENLVFARTIDYILAYLKKQTRTLKSMMYTSKMLEFNLLERINHLDYYLALGKLHTGYIRNFSKYDVEANDLYREMNLILDTIEPRLKRNVYRLNHRKTSGLRLHNSNILKMQKDYHRVYNLIKYFDKNKEVPKELTDAEIEQFEVNYFNYLKIITIFALMHFNFKADDKETINYNRMVNKMTYEGWTVVIKSNNKIIQLTISKEETVVLTITPSFYVVVKTPQDAIIFTPFSSEEKYEYLSISEVDSFRKIQRYIYRAMTYADTKREVCAFCGYKLIYNKTKDEYHCHKCNALIGSIECDTTKKKYYYTGIKNFIPKLDPNMDLNQTMHYRNITKLTKSFEPVCPYCNKIHMKS